MKQTVPKDSQNIDEPPKQDFPRWSLCPLSKGDLLGGLLLGVFVFSVNFIWYCLDHHVLMMDESGHVLNGLAYRELFSQPSPFKISWWQQLLTVNRFYPPTVYIETGIAKAFFGTSRLVDAFVHCGFSFILASSTYFSVRLLGFGLMASSLAGVLVNMYPEVSFLNHMIMLDFPVMAATSLGLLSILLWWLNPTVKNSIFCGFLLGICCLTKQIVTAFLLGPGLFVTVLILMNEGNLKRKQMIVSLFVLVIATIAMGLPWFLTNHAEMQSINHYMNQDLETTGNKMTHLDSTLYYLRSYWSNLGPLLCVLFILSSIGIGLSRHRQLLPIWASAAVGFAMMCLYIYPLDRYIASTFILTAAVSAIFLERLWQSGKLFLRIAVLVVVSMIALQYVSFNFCPYPISNPIMTKLSYWLGVKIPVSFSKDGSKNNPTPFKNWGYDWVFQEIATRDQGIPVYLNVLINEPNLNAQTFDLETKERRVPVSATTSLVWTVVGDDIEFSPESALYYHWYLVKDKMNRKFKNQHAKDNYLKLIDYLRSSGKFEFVSSMVTPGSDKISLFRQIR